MPKASDISKGDVVAINNEPHILEELKKSTPSARGAASIYHLRFRNLLTKNKVDYNVKGDEMFAPIDFEKRSVQFLFEDRGEFTFMDLDDFSQFTLNLEDLEDQKPFLVEDMEGIFALITDNKVVAIELPPSVNLVITQCDPSLKTASVTARQKNAVLETGLRILVPEYIESGEVVRVDTETGKFMSRA